VICPICENVQERGAECEVCGRRLGEPAPSAEPPTRLDGLEQTALAATPGGSSREIEGPLDGLEPSRFEAPSPAEEAAPASEEAEPWLERTGEPPASVAAPEPLEVERVTAGPRRRARTGAGPLAPVCRYCRTPAAAGEAFCARCGMKLSLHRASATAPAQIGQVRCHGCGTVVTGALCPGCGARRPAEER
jgi:hypothetical protein